MFDKAKNISYGDCHRVSASATSVGALSQVDAQCITNHATCGKLLRPGKKPYDFGPCCKGLTCVRKLDKAKNISYGDCEAVSASATSVGALSQADTQCKTYFATCGKLLRPGKKPADFGPCCEGLYCKRMFDKAKNISYGDCHRVSASATSVGALSQADTQCKTY